MGIFDKFSLKKKRQSVDGTKIAGGTFMEEYLGALKFPNAYEAFDKMRRQDYQIARVLRVLKAPLKAATFSYRPDDFTDESQIHQAAFKNKFFFEYPVKKWSVLLQEILSYLDFGHSVFEPYLHLVDDPVLGKIWTLKDLGFISQRTIDKWDIKQGEVKRIHQLNSYNEEYTDKWIDGKDLLIFSNSQEGSNYQGVSVLRPAYGCYVRKDLYLKLDMIGNEKMSIGTPLCYVPPQIWDNPIEKALLINILTAFTSHESAFLILPKILQDGGFEIVKGEFNNESIAKSIKREDTAIVDIVLASFLEIGTAKTGGNAQNEGHMQLFLNSLLAVAQECMDILDDYAHKAYMFNFGVPKTRLNMQAMGISKDDEKRLMEIIRGYITSEAIRPDDPLEIWLRNRLRLPQMNPETARKVDMVPDYKEDEEVIDEDQDRDDQDNPEEPAEEED